TSFSGSFKVSPLEDSDVDITGILVTATAINAAVPTLQETASDTFDVVVDAILDEQVQIVQTEEAFHSTSRGSVTMPLNLDLSMVDALFPGSLDGGPDDTDDSEKVSSVIITIDEPGADLTVDSPYGLTYNSSEGNYTLTGYSNAAELEIAIESLAVETPAGRYYGVINGTITTKTEDANLNGGLELDSEDNSREGVFHFYARVADNPLDGWLDITETATDPQFAKIGFYIDNSSLKLDIANAEDQSFGIDLSQLSSNPTIQNSIFDKVDISGNIGAQENNQLSLSAQDVLDFNRPLNIVGNTGDQVNLIDDDGPNEPGSWFNNTTLPDTYSYQDSTGNIIANITIDDSLTVVI
ncbi:MAG: hypothetical protein KAR12_05375, partial [Methylococcales bacterium]|nr:hypothetical protein [Methylococcales bacterium]